VGVALHGAEGVGAFYAQGVRHGRGLRVGGNGDDEGFSGLMELELPRFGAEEADALYLRGGGAEGMDDSLGLGVFVTEDVQIVVDCREAEFRFSDGNGRFALDGWTGMGGGASLPISGWFGRDGGAFTVANPGAAAVDAFTI